MVHSAELCDKIIKTQITLKMSSPFVMFNWFTFWVAWEWSLKAISNNFIENVRHMNGQSPCNAPEWLGGRKPPVPQGVLDKCERCSCWSCLKSLCGWSHSIIFEETSQFTLFNFTSEKLNYFPLSFILKEQNCSRMVVKHSRCICFRVLKESGVEIQDLEAYIRKQYLWLFQHRVYSSRKAIF